MRKILAILFIFLFLTGCKKDSDVKRIANYKIYKKSGDTVVEDIDNKLIWQKNIPDLYILWEDAKTYCSNLNYAGENDWRLPTISELKALIKGCHSGGSTCLISDNCNALACKGSYKSCWCEHRKGPGAKGLYLESDVWNYIGKREGLALWSSTVEASYDFEKKSFKDSSSFSRHYWAMSPATARLFMHSKDMPFGVICVRGKYTIKKIKVILN